jgi:hypothetical protein
MNEIYPNIYKNMNGGGLFNLFGTSSSDNSLLRSEMEQTLSHEVEQLKEYLVVPGNLNGFFKKIYLPKPISNPISEEDKGKIKLYNFIDEDINNKLTSNDTNIPQVVEIPRKIYKKGKSSDVVVEIESVKINKQDLLNHLANFKTDLDELLERVIKNLDKLKEKMLRHKLINLSNLQYFMENLYEGIDCEDVHKNIKFAQEKGKDALKEKIAAKESMTGQHIFPSSGPQNKSLREQCEPCNIIINNMNDMESYIVAIIEETKAELNDNNKAVRNFFYDYLMNKLNDKPLESYVAFMKAAYKKLLAHFFYNIYRTYKFVSLGKKEQSFKTDNDYILAACTIFVNSMYDYLNQPEYLRKALSLMNPVNYNLLCFKNVFNMFFNIETTTDNPISRLFLFNQITFLIGLVSALKITNYNYIDTIYINGTTNYLDIINASLGKYSGASKYKLCKINDMYGYIVSSYYSKLAYYNSKNQANKPIYLTETLFLLVDIGLTLYKIKSREIVKQNKAPISISNLACELLPKIGPPVKPRPSQEVVDAVLRNNPNLLDGASA